MRRILAAAFGIAGLGGIAACAMQSPGGPSALPVTMFDPSFAQAGRHAACPMASGLRRPVSGTAPLVIAFGQLSIDGRKRRYAYPGVAFAYRAGNWIYAATSGIATYYPNLSAGPAIVVRASNGVQTFYAGFARASKALENDGTIHVKAGQTIAVSGAANVQFEYAPLGNVLHAGTQSNPCGGGSADATGTVSIMPVSIPVYARFHSFSLDGVASSPGPYPASSPDVATPQTLIANVVVPHRVSAAVYERSDTFSKYYVVLCGNVAFATGPARYAGPFPYPNPTASSAPPQAAPALPKLVFFRDPGALGASLRQDLPKPYGRPCPAPGPADIYTSTQTFTWVGQTEFYWFWCTTASDVVTLSSTSTAVVKASPTAVPAYPSPQPHWPPPAKRTDVSATGVGSATVNVSDPGCNGNSGAIKVSVLATPTAAPLPTPVPNTQLF